MTADFLLPATDHMDCACAIFDARGPVLVSPSYRAYFGEGFAPPIEIGDTLPHHFSDPFCYGALRRDFILADKGYSLFTAMLYREGDSERQLDTRLCRADATFGYLLLLSEEGGRGMPCKIMDLFDTVCDLLREHVSSAVRVTTPLYNVTTILADRLALAAVLGLIVPDLLKRDEIEVFLKQSDIDSLAIGILGCGEAISPFVRTLACRFAAAGGFLLNFSEDGAIFTFRRCESTVHVLYAGAGEREEPACLRIALLLRGWQKP
ncbi:MAG: hypothetical protein IJ009_01570 [Clostridia bacterium]|nr:hypothetical protein [Clostridia bacterium]